MTAPIDLILPLLTKARQRQPGQWSACCPGHDDKRPSLSVRETPEGAVVAALGLSLADLFPPRKLSGNGPKRQPRLLTAGQALELLDREAQLVAVAASNMLHGVVLNQNDLTRITQAAGRITWFRDESLGGAHA